ncbi:MAG: hypothetical protein ACK42C_00020 [Aquificaceae bacterium]
MRAFLELKGLQVKEGSEWETAFEYALQGKIREEWLLELLYKKMPISKASKRLLKFFVPYGFDLAVVYVGFCISSKAPYSPCNPFPFRLVKIKGSYYKLRLHRACYEFFREFLSTRLDKVEDLLLEGKNLRQSCAKKRRIVELNWYNNTCGLDRRKTEKDSSKALKTFSSPAGASQ